MDGKTFFDFHGYMQELCRRNRLARSSGYHTTACSGMGHLEGLLQEFRSQNKLVAVSDVCDERTVQLAGGWFKRRLFTVYLTHPYTFQDMASFRAAMDTCRELYRQFQSRMLRDAATFAYRGASLNVGDIRSQELGGTLLNGVTGLLFMVTLDEPTDISYNREEWDDD